MRRVKCNKEDQEKNVAIPAKIGYDGHRRVCRFICTDGNEKKVSSHMWKEAYQKLAANIEDVMLEQQIKLGYRDEPVRLYYPLSSLNHFFGDEVSAEEMQIRLQDFLTTAQPIFGESRVTHKGDRFCFFLTEEASAYVHTHKQETPFIARLIELVSKHGVTKQDVIALFEMQEKPFLIKEMQSDEFDFYICFTEGEDRYYYCFKDEGCHMIYHRFLPQDYADLKL